MMNHLLRLSAFVFAASLVACTATSVGDQGTGNGNGSNKTGASNQSGADGSNETGAQPTPGGNVPSELVGMWTGPSLRVRGRTGLELAADGSAKLYDLMDTSGDGCAVMVGTVRAGGADVQGDELTLELAAGRTQLNGCNGYGETIEAPAETKRFTWWFEGERLQLRESDCTSAETFCIYNMGR